MNSAHIANFKGLSANSMMQLQEHFPDFQHVVNVVMGELHNQLGGHSMGGQAANRAALLSSPLVGVEQNSGLSNSLT